IGDSRLIGLLLDLNGNIKRRVVAPVPSPGRFAELTPLVAGTVEELSREATRLLGVGIAVAGMIDQAKGTVYAPNLHDSPVDLKKALASRIERPFVIENEANAMLLAEQTKGALRKRLNALSVNVGLGVGAGALIDGRLYNGH